MNREQIAASSIGAIALPIFEFIYGEGTAVMFSVFALAFFILLDWLSGSRASRKDNTYASHYGIDGVFRTFFMLLLPAGGHMIDVVFGIPGVVFGILVVGLLHHTIKSMTANAVRAGWAEWLPISLLEKLTAWVQSEIDSKIDRAVKRMSDREVGK
ncbi:phage holin family protein [Cohnella panacarvi]|uniref:phage holin family protein n=1 Tax=Cohnella panacarvi TaxID=400776 RepID=UPI0004789542|nr:phage holin family protein [Cohnella panacarvi]